MDDELPLGWVWARLYDLCDVHDTERLPIKREDREIRCAGKELSALYPYYGATGRAGLIDDFRSEGPAILLGEDGAPFLERDRPKAYGVSGRYWVNNHAHILRVRDLRYGQYLLHYLNYVDYSHLVTGTTRLKLTLDALRKMQICVAPPSEAERIGSEIDHLFGSLDEAEAALERAREGLTQYRASLLHAACTGALTAEWRKTNKPKETGADVPALPASWRWCKLGDVISDGPMNGLSPPTSSDEGGSIGLKLTATTSGTFDLSKHCLKRLSVKVDPGSRFFLSNGDLVFQRGNTREYVGMAAIYCGPPNTYVFPDLMIRVRMSDNKLAEWVWRYANSPLGRHYFQETASGTAGSMPKINGRVLREMPIAIPPPEERVHILGILDALIAGHNDNWRTLDEVEAQNARLRQSILHAAFAGRLVPQDPTDEPASTLLARLRAAPTAPRRRARLTRRV